MSKSIQFKCGKEENAYVHPFWPIGSIYLSLDETNPSKWFGGTWERIKDRFLLACGDAYANGATGGEASHELTATEMPKHTHAIPYNTTGGGYAQGSVLTVAGTAGNTQGSSGGGAWYTWTEEKGGGAKHNNMPPYLAVYVWKRVA